MELIRVQDSDYKKTYDLYMTFPENDEEKEWLDKQNFHNFAEDAYIG